MSVKGSVRLWCVGMCLLGGGHQFRVFDVYREARQFERSVNGSVYYGMSVTKVVLWEM